MFPYEITQVEEATNAALMRDFKGERNGFCQVGPKKWCLPLAYKEHAEQYYNFKPRSDDLWIVTFPRSGTTWTQELLWLVNNNLDFEKAAQIPLIERFPFYEFNIIHSKEFTDEILELNGYRAEVVQEIERRHTPGYVHCETLASPRHLKSHLPLSLLPPTLLDTAKVVYVARNPKDVAASFYHHNRHFTAHDYVGDFAQYWDYFEKDLLMYAPYWDHLEEAWGKKNHPNLLFLFYEDLINKMPECIKKIASFLNKPVTEEQIKRLEKHLHIENFKTIPIMKKVEIQGMINSNTEGFIRRGKVGGNKEYTEDMNAKADKWIEKNLAKTDLRFPLK